MTVPREWPNKAMAARDRSAERAVAGIKALKPLIAGNPITEEERIRRVAIATVNLQHIARMMEAVGAKTTDPMEGLSGEKYEKGHKSESGT